MLSEGLTPNLVTYNTLLEVHAKRGLWRDAVGVLDTLEQQVGCGLGGGSVCIPRPPHTHTATLHQCLDGWPRTTVRHSLTHTSQCGAPSQPLPRLPHIGALAAAEPGGTHLQHGYECMQRIWAVRGMRCRARPHGCSKRPNERGHLQRCHPCSLQVQLPPPPPTHPHPHTHCAKAPPLIVPHAFHNDFCQHC